MMRYWQKKGRAVRAQTTKSIYPVGVCSLRVHDLPEQERPREQVDRKGVEHVADSVLIAILLRSGIKGTSVVQVAINVLKRYGTLNEIARASVDELAQLRGMGHVRAQVLKAALELGKRMDAAQEQPHPKILSPEDAVRVLWKQVRSREEESFWVLLLDVKNRLKQAPLEISRGILDASLVHAREVFREAIRSACGAVVLAHNHPSGDTHPSAADLSSTKGLIAAGKIVEIAVLDHIIIGTHAAGSSSNYLSMKEEGLLSF